MPPIPHPQAAQLANNTQKSEKPSRQHGSRQRPPKNLHPLQTGIREFTSSQVPQSQLSKYGLSIDTLTSALPKRYTVYEPLLLLPANTFNAPPAWAALYAHLTESQRKALYASIAHAFSRMGVTHIAVNAPIALTDAHGQENRLRSPTGLVPLYGDFGNRPLDATAAEGNAQQPSAADFEGALWVRTAQNHGIVQIWAPLYTMFSRGNITEKARILGQGGASAHEFEGLDDHSLLDQSVADICVVDMYAGIGYFVFSYLRRGVRRVWGWELNSWSVEGLRRGCVANGWGCIVVKLNGEGGFDESIQDLVANLSETDRVVIFYGDNRCAADILTEVKDIMERKGTWNPVRHVNLGLLPSSQPSWENACRMVDARRGGWLHIHENVDIRDIEQKKQEVVDEIIWLRTLVLDGWDVFEEPIAHCGHVEQVKTYAPGVMHCVFDVRLSALRNARI